MEMSDEGRVRGFETRVHLHSPAAPPLCPHPPTRLSHHPDISLPDLSAALELSLVTLVEIMPAATLFIGQHRQKTLTNTQPTSFTTQIKAQLHIATKVS